MSQRLSRKEMKRDEVGAVLSRAMVLLSSHIRQVGLAIGALVAVFVLGMMIERALVGRRDLASDALADAIQTLNAPLTSELPAGGESDVPTYGTVEERRHAARKQFDEIAERYQRSKTGRVARSYVAALAHEETDSDRARALWQALSRGEDVIAMQSVLNLLTLDREEGRAAEVENRLLAMLEESPGALSEDVVLYQLAVTQEELGKTPESLETYRRLLEDHPRSVYAAEANRRTASATVAG